MTDKITSEHLARTAYVYIRQSTPDQVQQNKESRERQYALRERARALGWRMSLQWMRTWAGPAAVAIGPATSVC